MCSSITGKTIWSLIPEEERADMVAAYYRRLTGDDEICRMHAAKAWSVWEGRCATPSSSPQVIERFSDARRYAIARIECHYFANKTFLAPNQLLDNMERIAHIPGIIVHGRYDMVCPLDNAHALHQRWPGSELNIIRDAGHAASEPGIADALVRATGDMARRLLNRRRRPSDMKGLLQRVSQARVEVEGEIVGSIDQGLLVLVGIEPQDDEASADKLLKRLLEYRVFTDVDGRMNDSLTDVQGGLLLVSQFTLAADTRKGRRPGFSTAAPPDRAEVLFNYLVDSGTCAAPTGRNRSFWRRYAGASGQRRSGDVSA